MIDKKLLIRRLSLTVYFIAAFLVFLLLLFPFDRVKSKLEFAVHQRTPIDLSIGRISPRFFNSFVLTDVVLSDRSGKVLFESPSVGTTISLYHLLRRLVVFDVNARAYGGNLVIKMRSGPGSQQLALDAEGLDIGSYSLLKSAGLKLSGNLGGNIDFIGSNGRGRLQLKGLAWRDLKVKGFAVPDMKFDSGLLEADIKGDRMTVKKMELDGKDLSVHCQGEVVLRERGLVNLTVKLKPSARLEREQAGILSLMKNKGSDGYYQIVIGGTLAEPAPRL